MSDLSDWSDRYEELPDCAMLRAPRKIRRLKDYSAMNSPVISAYRRFGDIPFVAVLILLAAMIAARALSDWQGPAGSLTNDLYIPALMMAHGRGMVNVDPADVPGLRAFLDFQAMTFPKDLLPGDLPVQPMDVYQQYHRYLICVVGIGWWCFGVSWGVVRGVCIVFYVLTVLLVYGVARLAMRRPFAALVAAAFIASPAPLVVLPVLRDFAKAPFIIATLIILGTIIVRPRRTRWFWAMCVLLGLVIGVGLGFRRDLMVFLLPGGLIPLVCARPPMRFAIVERLAGVVLMLAAFFLSAWPILRSFQEHGTLGYHDMIMGLATVSDDNAGLRRASYERIYILHDLYASEAATSLAARTHDHAVFMEQYNLHPDRAKRDLLIAMASTFPGDMITRAYAATAQVLNGVPTFPNPPNALWVLLAAATLLGMAGRNLRLAAFVAFIVAYYAGITSLQYLYRHSFHLAFAPYWFAGLAADWILAAIWTWRRSDPRRNLLEAAFAPRQCQGPSLRNMAIFAGAAVLIIAAPLYAARHIQMRQVDTLMTQCAAAELQPAEVATKDDALGRLYCPIKPLVLRPEGPLWEEKIFLTSYVVLDFDIVGHIPCFWVLYEGTHDFSRKLTAYPDHLPGEGAIRYFLPVYEAVDPMQWSRFRGILLPDDSGLALRAMHTVCNVENFGLIINIGIPAPPLVARRTQQIQWRQKDVNPCFVPYGESYPQQLRRRAREMAASGATVEALHLLHEAAQVEPWRMETVLELAALQEKTGDTDAAQRTLETLVAENPHEPVAADALDDFLERRGGLQARVAGWRQIAESSPGSSCARHFLGKALLSAGDRTGAQESLRRALAQNPELLYGSAMYLLAFADTLEELFEEFHVDSRRAAPAMMGAAAHLAQEGEYRSAIAFFNRIKQAWPDYYPAYIEEGASWFALGDPARAAECFSTAVAIRPGLHEAVQSLNECYVQMMSPEGRVSAWATFLQQHPEAVLAYMYWAQALADAGQSDAAIEAYRESLRRFPKNDTAHAQLGMLLINKGHYRRAVASLRESLRLNPHRGDAHAALIRAYLEMGKIRAARRAIADARAQGIEIPKELSDKAGLF